MKVVGFDTETYLFAPGRTAPPLVCLTIFDMSKPQPYHGELYTSKEGAFEKFVELLRDPEVLLVGHFVAFDCAVMAEHAATVHGVDLFPELFKALRTGKIRCTAVREKLIAIAFDRFEFDRERRIKPAFNLAELVGRYFNTDISEGKAKLTGHQDIVATAQWVPGTPPTGEPWRLRYAELDGVPGDQWPPEARSYAINDAMWAACVFTAQGAMPMLGGAGMPVVDEHGNVTDEVPQTYAAFAFQLSDAWGMNIDQAAVDVFENAAKNDVEKSTKIGSDLGFIRPPDKHGKTSKDTKKLQALVAEACSQAGQAAPLTATGKISTKRDVLVECGGKLAEFAHLGKATKHLTTYVPKLRRGVHGPFNPRTNILVRSGRTSGDTQQGPRGGGFRECFVARPGHVWCSVDYDIAELKALAQIQLWWFGTSALADAICGGLDPHRAIAVDILKLRTGDETWTYERVLAVAKAGPSHPDYDIVEGPQGARQLGKIVNFGCPGGLGPKSLAPYAKGYGVDLTRDEAAALIGVFKSRWVENAAYFARVAAATQVGTFTAVQCVSGRQRGGVGFTDGCNTYFQGFVADFGKAAAASVQEECYTGVPTEGVPLEPVTDATPEAIAHWGDKAADILAGKVSPLYGCRGVLFIHDEFIVEMPAAVAHWAAMRQAKVMCAVGQMFLPDVPVTATPALMLRWYKGAKDVWVDGRLVPWTPPTKAPAVIDVEAPEEDEEGEE